MMTLILVTAIGVAIVIGVVLLVVALRHRPGTDKKKANTADQAYNDAAIEEVSHLFNEEFREELRNRGRLRFEKIINENAMFLKQDLDMTIAQVNEQLKTEIGGKLEKEVDNYGKAMKDAQQLALDALQRSVTAVETQRAELAEVFKKDLEAREAALLKAFEDNLAKIVEYYLLQALSDQLDLRAQLPMIIKQLEQNKQAIMEDMRL